MIQNTHLRTIKFKIRFKKHFLFKINTDKVAGLRC